MSLSYQKTSAGAIYDEQGYSSDSFSAGQMPEEVFFTRPFALACPAVTQSLTDSKSTLQQRLSSF